MIILNAGVPRSGTVLVNAIVRELLRDVAPAIIQFNPHGEELPDTLARLQDNGQNLHATCQIHTHNWSTRAGHLVRGAAHVRAVVNYRDPRDVCVSMMKLHDLDYAQVAGDVVQYFKMMRVCAVDTDALVMPYELLVASPEAAIFQIGRHLGLWPALSRVAEIARATSSEQHHKVMQDVRAGARINLTERHNSRRTLVEDRDTLINDRHIQSGARERWRTELTAAEQNAAAKQFAQILVRYGYPVDP